MKKTIEKIDVITTRNKNNKVVKLSKKSFYFHHHHPPKDQEVVDQLWTKLRRALILRDVSGDFFFLCVCFLSKSSGQSAD